MTRADKFREKIGSILPDHVKERIARERREEEKKKKSNNRTKAEVQIWDLYIHTFRDSKTWRQEGDITQHYDIALRGKSPSANYKYFISTDHIGSITDDETYKMYTERGIDECTSGYFRIKYNLDPNIPFGA